MNIRIAVVLLILTLIFAVIFFYFFSQDSRITKLLVTQDPSNTEKTGKVFTNTGNDIYLLIKLSKVKKGEKIKISWYRNSEENKMLLIQDNNILIESQGSGFLEVSLANKNGNYARGNYNINVFLNENPEKPIDFIIK
jgi:hypothetical protein